MRVLFLSHVPAYGSGSGIYAAQVAGTLARRGHQVALLTPARSAYDVPAGVRLERIGVPGRPGRWTFAGDFPTFSGHRDSSLLYNQLTDEQLASYLDVVHSAVSDFAGEFAPDVIHVNHAFLLAGVVSDLGRWPSVVVSHGSELLRPLNSRLDELRQRALDGAVFLTAVSRASRDELARCTGRAQSTIPLVPPGYDSDVFRPLEVHRAALLRSLGIGPDRPCVAYLGRLVAYKRIGDLLRAVAAVPAAVRPNVLVMGDGSERDGLVELAALLGLEGVRFHPAVHAPARVAEVMNAVDAVVLTSEDDPFPMSGIEAMACGTPVIVSDSCGIAEIVADRAGGTYQTGNVGALSELLHAACADDWKRVRGRHAIEVVRDYTWCDVTDALTTLYERAVERERCDL